MGEEGGNGAMALDDFTVVRLAKRYGLTSAEVEELSEKCGGDARATEYVLDMCERTGINHRAIGGGAFFFATPTPEDSHE